MTMSPALAEAVKNASIKLRIGASFAVLVVMIGLLGGFAIDATGRIHQATEEIQAIWLPSVRELATLRYLGVRHRAIASRHAMVQSDADKAQVDERLTAIKQEFETTKARYLPLITSSEERALFTTADRRLADYFAAIDGYVRMSRARDPGAIDAYTKQASPLSVEAEAAVGKVIALNNEGAALAEARATAAYVSAQRMVAVAIAAALAFAVLAGWFLVRSVAGPVNRMTAAMMRLAEHDVDVMIPATGLRNEIGRM